MQQPHTHNLQALRIKEDLPETWPADALQWFTPLAAELARQHANIGHSLCVGINGAQGTGKSTLAKTLVMMLEDQYQLKAVALSLDDFYLSRSHRAQLANDIHPLLATRGVPGTHNTALAIRTLENLQAGQSVCLPQFSKATDDTVPDGLWPESGPQVDIIILEGWCVGLGPQPEEALTAPVNELEANEDPQGIWRRFANTHLATDYQALFARLDFLLMLKAPDFEHIFQWRCQQEEKLATRLAANPTDEPLRLMTPEQIRRFIAHYQRLTQHALDTLPSRADVTFELGADHRITRRRQISASTS